MRPNKEQRDQWVISKKKEVVVPAKMNFSGWKEILSLCHKLFAKMKDTHAQVGQPF